MKNIIDCELDEDLKKSIIQTVELLLDTFRQRDRMAEEIERWEKDSNYTEAARQQKADKLKQELSVFEDKQTRSIMAHISEIEDTARKKYDLKFSTPEHQAAIANAYKAVELLGASISREQMQGIVNPFILAGDTQTLSVLKSLYWKNVSPDSGLLSIDSLEEELDFGVNLETSLSIVKEFKNLVGMCLKGHSSIQGSVTEFYLNQFLKQHQIEVQL